MPYSTRTPILRSFSVESNAFRKYSLGGAGSNDSSVDKGVALTDAGVKFDGTGIAYIFNGIESQGAADADTNAGSTDANSIADEKIVGSDGGNGTGIKPDGDNGITVSGSSTGAGEIGELRIIKGVFDRSRGSGSQRMKRGGEEGEEGNE